MFEFNNYIDGVREVYSFWSFSQNWFDVVSLFITLFGLWFAYRMGEHGYKRDKKDKKEEHNRLVASEVDLLKNSLTQLSEAASKQIEHLKKYKDEQNFSLEYRADVQIDFLKFIDIKNVYEYYGANNEDNVKIINELFATLFSINDFRHSLRDTVRTAMKKYNMHEQGFYKYRKLMYKMVQEIMNKKAIDFKIINGQMAVNFGANLFAKEFHQLIQSELANPNLYNADKTVIRSKIIEFIVIPSINLAQGFIPMDEDAIEVSDVANEVNSEWINMNAVMTSHYIEIDGHIVALEQVVSEIKKFLELKK